VAREVALEGIGGVGVRVEMDDPDLAPADRRRHRRRRRPGDRVVASEDDGKDAALSDLGDSCAYRGMRGFDEPVRADRVTEVDDIELIEDLDPEVEVERAGVVGERPQRPRAETGARSIRRRVIPRGTDDRDVRLPRVEFSGLGEKRSLGESRDTLERGPAELLREPRRHVSFRRHRGLRHRVEDNVDVGLARPRIDDRHAGDDLAEMGRRGDEGDAAVA
jgi:hypothetical protein